MKYIIINDLTYVFRKYFKIILVYFLACLLYFYLVRDLYLETHNFFILNGVLALSINYNILISNPIISSLIIATYFLFIGLAIVIYKNDMDNYDNLFFRISFKNWIISKIIVMFIIIFLINLVVFLNAILSKTVGFDYFIIMFKKVIVITSLISLIYLILLFYNKFRIISFLILLVIIGVIAIGFDIQKISMLLALICWFITFIITIIVSKFIEFSDLKG